MPETIDLRSDSEDDVAVVADEDKFLLTVSFLSMKLIPHFLFYHHFCANPISFFVFCLFVEFRSSSNVLLSARN